MWKTVFTVAMLSLTISPAFAQLALTIDSVDASAFPTVRLRVTTQAGQVLRRDLDSSKYTLTEDGFPQPPLRKECVVGTNPFSVAVVIGIGSTMASGDVAFARGVADQLFDQLDGLNDEGAIVTYADFPVVVRSMTSAKSFLKDGLTSITNTPQANKMWDGVYEAVNQAFLSSNPRSILVLSNGIDDGSGKTFPEVVQWANTTNTKVFCLGINASGGVSNLQDLATATNGHYFSSAEQALQTLVNTMRGTPDYCTMTYTSTNRCEDGLSRPLSLKVKDGIDSATTAGAYVTAVDPASNVTALFAIDTVSGTGGKPVTVPIRLVQPVAFQKFNPATARLTFDTARVRLTGVRVDSSRLATTGATFQSEADGATISFTGASILNGSGALATLTFASAEVAQNTVVPVALTGWTFAAGCIQPQRQDGRITLRPKAYGLRGTASPVLFVWSDAAKDYTPSPAEMRIEFLNSGDLPLSGLQAALPPDPGIRLAGGSTWTTSIVPQTLAPGQKGFATWHVRAVPRATETTLQLDVTATSIENFGASARQFINIKPATSAVSMETDADTVRVSGGQHTPNPASIRATIVSAGTQDGPAGSVTITLPAALSLAGGTATQAFAALAPGARQTLSWQVNYPTDLPTVSAYDISIALGGTGAPGDTMHVTLTIPPRSGANVVSTCISVPTPIEYDTLTRGYKPVLIHATIRNAGGSPSDSISAEIALPPMLGFLGGEIPRKHLSPSLAAGDSVTGTWYAAVLDVTCDPVRTGDIAYRMYTNSALAFECTAGAEVHGRPNLLPEVTARVPSSIDTVETGTDVDFSVTARDPENDALTYSWSVNDTLAVSQTNAYTRAFAASGTYTVRCVIKDFCAADSVLVEWKDIVVRTGTDASGPAVAADFILDGNFPNPFSNETTIRFTVRGGMRDVTLDVLNAVGEVVGTRAWQTADAGVHDMRFRADRLPSGVYWIRLRAGAAELMRPMFILK